MPVLRCARVEGFRYTPEAVWDTEGESDKDRVPTGFCYPVGCRRVALNESSLWHQLNELARYQFTDFG